MMTSHEKTQLFSKEPSVNRKFCDGLATGLISTYLWNPVDKALYLMVKENKSFFDPTIWKQPYKGVTSALYSRTLGYGIYFSLYDMFRQNHGNLMSSVLTGFTIPLFNNPVNVIKMYHWNSDVTKTGIIKLGQQLYTKHGPKIFWYGVNYSIMRDVTFSTVFYTVSERYNQRKSFLIDILSASTATVIASPLNYFRSRLYFDFNNPVKFSQIMTELVNDVNKQNNKLSYLFMNKFNIGWGTLRVGVGMALSKKMYEYIQTTF